MEGYANDVNIRGSISQKKKKKINHKYLSRWAEIALLTTDGGGISTCISEDGSSSVLFLGA